MTYEELKQDTTRYFANKGMKLENESFLKEMHQQHQIVINGQPNIQTETIKIQIDILGEGSIEDKPMIGLKIKLNDQDRGDFWISDTKDLASFNI